MRSVLTAGVLVAVLAVGAVSCTTNPPPTAPSGTGCRDLPATDASGPRQSIRWNGSYTGRFEVFANDTCQAPSFVRWTAYRLALQGDLAATTLIANGVCTDLATAALPTDTNLIGPFTYRYKEFLDGNLGSSTGVPEDLWMCAAAYIDNQGNARNWPTDLP